MGFRNVAYALDHSPYKGTQRLIHVVLADSCNDEHHTGYPSQTFIARRANCSVETVRTAIKQMIADGYIEIIQPSSAHGNTAHLYRFVLPKGFGDLPKSAGGPPQIQTGTSPNPSPTNHKRTTTEPQCPSCGGENGRHQPGWRCG